MAEPALRVWLRFLLVALISAHVASEGVGEAVSLWDDDLSSMSDDDLGLGDSDPDLESLRNVADDAKDRVLLKREQAQTSRSENQAVAAALSQAKADLSNEPQTQIEAKQRMDAKGAAVSRQAAMLAPPADPALSPVEVKDFQWGLDAAAKFEKAAVQKQAPAESTDDLTALEKEVAADEINEDANDKQQAAKIAGEIKRKQAEAAQEAKEEEQVQEMQRDEVAQEAVARQAKLQAQNDEATMEAQLQAMSQTSVSAPAQAATEAAAAAEDAIQQVRARSALRAKEAAEAGADRMSNELESAAQKQERANREAAARIEAQGAALDSQLEAVGTQSRDSLVSVAGLAGLAQNAVDALPRRDTSSSRGRAADTPDAAAMEHKAASDAAKEVKSAMKGDMANLQAQITQYKAQMAAEGKAPHGSDPALVALENKLARMQGQVQVVREEEKAGRGNSAQTAELLAQERALMNQERAARQQAPGAPAQPAVAAPAQPAVAPAAAAPVVVTRITPSTAAAHRDLKVQRALIRRVDTLEKALLAVKNLHQASSHNAQDARNAALEAHMQLLEKELQDVKAQKQASSLAQDPSIAALPALAKMQQELQHDAQLEKKAVQGAAASEQAQYSDLTLAKKKSVLLRQKAQLEAKLDRLRRENDMSKTDVESRLEANKAAQQLAFDQKVAQLADGHEEAARVQRTSIEHAEEEVQRKLANDKEQAEAKEEALAEKETEKKSAVAAAKLKIESVQAIEQKQEQMTKAAEAKVAAKLATLTSQKKLAAKQESELGAALHKSELLEKEAEASEQQAAAKKDAASQQAQKLSIEEEGVAAKLRGDLFKKEQISAMAAAEQQQVQQLRAEIAASKKKLALKDALHAKLLQMQEQLQKAGQDKLNTEQKQQETLSQKELAKNAKNDELKDMKMALAQVRKHLERNQAAVKEQESDATVEQEKETATLKRELEDSVSKMKEELKDQRASHDVLLQQLRERLRNAQTDKQGAEVASSKALAELSRADASQTDQELSDAQQRQQAKESATKAKVKAEEAKAAAVEAQAHKVLNSAQASSQAALDRANAESRRKLREAKLQAADELHRQEQHYARQVAAAQQAEHADKEAAVRTKQTAVHAEKVARASAEKNVQQVMAQIAARSEADERNAFVQAHKDKHSALAEAVALQQDATQKLLAAQKSFKRASEEAQGARSRATQTKASTEASIEGATSLTDQNRAILTETAEKAQQIKQELAHEQKELAKHVSDHKHVTAEIAELEARTAAAESENKRLHAAIAKGGGVKTESADELEEVSKAVETLRGKIAQRKASLRAVQRMKAQQVMDAAKADQQRTQAALEQQKNVVQVIKAKHKLAVEAAKQAAVSAKQEADDAAVDEEKVKEQVKEEAKEEKETKQEEAKPKR